MNTDEQQQDDTQDDTQAAEGNQQQPAEQHQPATPTADQAKQQLAALEADRAYMAACFAGDKAKIAERDRLYAAAYPENPDASLAGDGIVQRSESAETGEQEWLAPPHTPGEYNFGEIGHAEAGKPEQAKLESKIRQALHAERVPQFAVAAVCDVIARGIERGLPDESALARSELTGRTELQLRYGTEEAQRMIAAAGKVFARLDARDPRIADLLVASGAASSAYVVETLSKLARG